MRDLKQIRERSSVRRKRPVKVHGIFFVGALGISFGLGYLAGHSGSGPTEGNVARASAPSASALAKADKDAREQALSFPEQLRAEVDADAQATQEVAAAEAGAASPQDDSAQADSPEVGEASAGVPHATESGAENSTEAALKRALAAAPSAPRGVDPEKVAADINRGPAKDGDFTIQVSAFQTKEEAQAYAAGLRRKGYEPFVVTSSLNGRGTWYRVRLGRFSREDDANYAKTLLAQAEIPAWVLQAE